MDLQTLSRLLTEQPISGDKPLIAVNDKLHPGVTVSKQEHNGEGQLSHVENRYHFILVAC